VRRPGDPSHAISARKLRWIASIDLTATEWNDSERSAAHLAIVPDRGRAARTRVEYVLLSNSLESMMPGIVADMRLRHRTGSGSPQGHPSVDECRSCRQRRPHSPSSR
jgi:hypothetical protein